HIYRNRCTSLADRSGVERDEISQVNGRDKDHFTHGLRNERFRRLTPRFDTTGEVDVAEDDSAKNRAGRVGVFRQHRDPDCRESFCHFISVGPTGQADFGTPPSVASWKGHWPVPPRRFLASGPPARPISVHHLRWP